ncbi:Multidrug transporter activation protein [Legionella pneumophila]|uniref:MerR family transcriptional regulator n=1 Tax=Legionella pneumophila TaxID=446 RepID=UPI000770985E|nr:MerR family transcriptional regulator [Legionella pneumophila]CZG39505.1 Multidrug transporter activation protein [Legionella pneumophila]CZH40595.1 Multidrug transporter activation protein [Legionella pneumophila]
MPYTVTQLAKMSGVSKRTLRFYDELGLLKPAYYGENQYRYYEEAQLILLQQILFYRELGFPLADIQRILSSDDFNIIEALKSHKKILKGDLVRTKGLIQTIDRTINHLEGKITMKDEELYYGFDSEIQKEHEKTLVERGVVTQEFMDECNKKVAKWTDKEKNDFINQIERIINSLISAMENGLNPESVEVQKLLEEHYTWLVKSWTPNKEKYLGLIELYQTPEFRKFYDKRHPDLLEYLVGGMYIYAKKKFSETN